MFLDNVFVNDDNVVGREIAGEFILVPVVRNVAEIGSIFVLNEVGSAVWSAVREHRSGHEIVKRVLNDFEVTEDEARRDVEEFLKQLSDAGLVKVESTWTP